MLHAEGEAGPGPVQELLLQGEHHGLGLGGAVDLGIQAGHRPNAQVQAQPHGVAAIQAVPVPGVVLGGFQEPVGEADGGLPALKRFRGGQVEAEGNLGFLGAEGRAEAERKEPGDSPHQLSRMVAATFLEVSIWSTAPAADSVTW